MRALAAQRGQTGEQGVPPPVVEQQGEARTVAVQHDKGCFYTCHEPFNHLPLQTGESDDRGLHVAFSSSSSSARAAVHWKAGGGIKLNCVFHKKYESTVGWEGGGRETAADLNSV